MNNPLHLRAKTDAPWVAPFIAWANEDTNTLNFNDADVPPRVTELLQTAANARPHSRACGIVPHPHGRGCSRDCPTCHP